MSSYLFIDEWNKLNASIKLATNFDIFEQRFLTSFLDYRSIIVSDLFYFIWMVYDNLQLEIEDPHQNHLQVNWASSLNIFIIIIH